MNTTTLQPETPSNPIHSKRSLESSFAIAYQAQLSWSQTKVVVRTALINNVRSLLVIHRLELARAIQSPSRQDYRETITSELMPLADTAKWLHKQAKRILAPRHVDAGKSPFWLGRLRSTVFRVPCGLVMIVGTWNYPLFLTGAQVLHALAAGNAVVIKPAIGAEQVTQLLVDLLIKAGVPKDLMIVLDSSIDRARDAIAAGVDKVVMTGSSQSGRAVLSQLADTLTPAVMELSGCDAVYVLPGADMHRVCDLLLFGLRLNGGATCMAPRRVFVPSKSSEVFYRLLAQRLETASQLKWTASISQRTYSKMMSGVEDAVRDGATIFSQGAVTNQVIQKASSPNGPSGTNEASNAINTNEAMVECGHLVLTNMNASMRLCAADLFAPLIMIIPVEDWSEALRSDSQCPYALTVSVFGPTEDALRLVKFISAGFITINDMIVPTADPQLPFGGRGESGFGATRGPEGLLEMTFPKVVSTRLGSWLPHSKLPEVTDEQLLDGLLQFSHRGGWKGRFAGLLQTIRAAMSQRKSKNTNNA
jgi:acyl-CoA reductase-like NAD-dependent aldehyde dehydrogenase